VLLHLLGDPISLHASFPAEDPVAIHRQSGHRPALLARFTHLGVRKSPHIQGPFHFARQCNRERLFLGVFVSAERGAWVLRDVGCEYSGFHGGRRTLRFPRMLIDAPS